MKLYDMVELAGRNLREAGLRNSLTTVGISVGVASLVAMLSLGIGLQQFFNRQLGRSGLFDSIFVAPRSEYRGGRAQPSDLTPPKPLDDAARKSFEQVAGVDEVYPYFSAVGEFRLEGTKPEESHFSVVGGLPPSARGSEAFDDFQGEFYSAGDAPEAIILADFARVLLGLPPEPQNADQKLTQDQASRLLGRNLVFRYAQRATDTTPPLPTPSPSPSSGGQSNAATDSDSAAFNVIRKEQNLKIVGIVSSEPYRGMRQGRTSVLLPVAFAETLNMIQPGDVRSLIRPGQGKTYNNMVVRVAKSKQVSAVEDQIKKLGFNAFSIVDASKNLTLAFTFLDLFLGIFGSLALAVASLGIVNTLVMAILERRREIGIMKAVGASDADVKKIFFVEAGTMGVLGGALGAGLGWVIGRAINLGTNVYMSRHDLKPQDFWYVPLWLVIAALIFSVVVSLFAGLYPASRAARLNPVEALRHE
jgi:putative ABC transport system permease protein